jgi:hypothetical protein
VNEHAQAGLRRFHEREDLLLQRVALRLAPNFAEARQRNVRERFAGIYAGALQDPLIPVGDTSDHPDLQIAEIGKAAGELSAPGQAIPQFFLLVEAGLAKELIVLKLGFEDGLGGRLQLFFCLAFRRRRVQE